MQALDDERVDVLAIDSALTRLAQIDPPQSRIVELRYFGGLTLEETASVAGISLASVKREWAMARAWLRRELAATNTGAGLVTPERWAQVKALLSAAMDLPDAERAGFLAREPDAELVQEVQSLLAMQDQPGGFLETVTHEFRSQAFAAPAPRATASASVSVPTALPACWARVAWVTSSRRCATTTSTKRKSPSSSCAPTCAVR